MLRKFASKMTFGTLAQGSTMSHSSDTSPDVVAIHAWRYYFRYQQIFFIFVISRETFDAMNRWSQP